MSWTRSSDIKVQLQRLWDRGEILAEALSRSPSFPRKLTFKVPTSSELASRFEDVRGWIADIKAMKNCRVEYRVTNHRQLGRNEVPAELWIDSVEDALVWLGKLRAFKQFADLIEMTRSEQPDLLPWMEKNALRVVELAAVWMNLMKVVAWMQCNPRPNIYIREVDLAGVDSKFIEQHRAILAELLDCVLPPEAIDATASGVIQFAARYGFRAERESIRFRILDPSCAVLSCNGDQDISVDLDTFADLRPRVKRLFITENKTNFLAFPSVPESMVVFGAGYGWDAIARAHWLFHCDIYYWGDIDTHGFAILNQLRSSFPHVVSLLMDDETASRFVQLAVTETKPTDSPFDFLTSSELALLSRIRAGELGPRFRLEQERIEWSYARARIDAVVANSLPDSIEDFPHTPLEISSGDFISFLRPSRCEKRLRLLSELRLAESKPSLDARSPLDLVLADLADRHRAERFSNISDLIDLSHIDSPSARSAATVSAISSRVRAIRAPLMTVSTRIAGVAVTIFAEADLLRLNADDQYEATNFKLARRVEDHLELVYELSLFAWMFENVTGTKLPAVYVENPHDPPIKVKPAISSAFRTIGQMIRAQCQSSDCYTPVGWSKCLGCSFRTHCWTTAVASNDVALVPDVEQELAVAFHRVGADSMQSLLELFDPVALTDFQYRAAGKTARVGKRADSILRSARALTTNSVIWQRDAGSFIFPSAAVIIDFEGVPPPLVPEEFVYLWGIQSFGTGASEYSYSLCRASYEQSDRDAWFHFLQSCELVLRGYPGIQFFHYHHYETTMIRRYIQRYGDKSDIATRVLQQSVDVHKLLREAVCLPVFSYGLKEVERLVGFSRSQQDYGGDWSIAAYLRAMEDPSPNAFDDIVRYNAEDIASTWHVLSWLRENCASRSTEGTRSPLNT